jgi:hypothetical protein
LRFWENKLLFECRKDEPTDKQKKNMKAAPKFHAFKKTESGQYFIQWKKAGKFCLVSQIEAEFVIFSTLINN